MIGWYRTLFTAYARWSIGRKLDGLWVRGVHHAREAIARGPVILATTHVSWWDGILLMPLDHALGRPGKAWMDAQNLQAVRFLAPLGVVPIDRRSPAAMRAGVRDAAAWLSAPGRALWVFPQGRQRPHHLRPLGLQRGHEILARSSGAAVVPVGLGYGFREADVPAAVVSFGPVTTSLEEALATELDAVDAFLDRGEGGFEPLVASRKVRTDKAPHARLLDSLIGGASPPSAHLRWRK